MSHIQHGHIPVRDSTHATPTLPMPSPTAPHGGPGMGWGGVNPPTPMHLPQAPSAGGSPPGSIVPALPKDETDRRKNQRARKLSRAEKRRCTIFKSFAILCQS